MKEIFLNLIAFQVLSTDQVSAKLSRSTKKKTRFSILAAAFLVIVGVQIGLNLVGREQNYFEVLGLSSSTATLEQVTTSYEELNQRLNPAFNTDPNNLVRFKKIQEAYDCLKTF